MKSFASRAVLSSFLLALAFAAGADSRTPVADLGDTASPVTLEAAERAVAAVRLKGEASAHATASSVAPKTTANGLTFSGNYSFSRTGNSVTLKVARIDNDSFTRTTGTLRLELWAASTRPPAETGFNGYRLAASATLAPLAPRTFYTDVIRTATFTEPPSGTYYMVMVLGEFGSSCSGNDSYCLTDSGVFTSQQTFGTGTPPPPPPPPPPSATAFTVISRAGSQCYENYPADAYTILQQTSPGLFQSYSVGTTCASLGMGFYAGTLLGTGGAVRVYTTDASVAQTLCSTGVVVGCNTTPPPPPPATTSNFTDLWYNPSESGWGVSITHHGSGIGFIAWYTYDGFGNPKWYFASSCRFSGNACSGTLYETSGPPFGSSFNASSVTVRAVGTITFNFSSADNGVMSYTINGVAGSKSITRLAF